MTQRATDQETPQGESAPAEIEPERTNLQGMLAEWEAKALRNLVTLGFRVEWHGATNEWDLRHDKLASSLYCRNLAQLEDVAQALTIFWQGDALYRVMAETYGKKDAPKTQ